MKELVFGSKFRKGSGTSKFVIFAFIAVFGVLTIALLAPSSGFTNNPFSPYSTYTTTVSGSTYTITQQPTVTTTSTFAGPGGTTIPLSIVGNVTGSQITGVTATGGFYPYPNQIFKLSFTLTGQTGSHTQLTVCLPQSDVVSSYVPLVTVNGAAPESQSYTISNGQTCVTFTTHFSTDQVVINYVSPISVTTNQTSYPSVAGTRITVSGIITPAIGVSGTSATVAITNSHGLFVTNSTAVNPSTGAYSITFVSLSNTSSLWVSGVYTATVTWAAGAPPSPVFSGTGTFGYGTTTSTTTTTQTSTSGTGITITSNTTITSTVNTSTVITTTISGTAVTITTSVPGTPVTTTQTGALNTTVIAIGAAAVIIAIIAGALAAMALRKK